MGYMLGQDGSPFPWGGATSPSVPPGGWTDLEGVIYNADGTPYNASGLASDPSGIWSQGMPTAPSFYQKPDWRTTTGYSGVAFNDVAKQVSQQTGIPVDDLAKAFDYQVSTIPSVEGGTLGAASWWGSNQKAEEMLLGYVAQHPDAATKLSSLINNYGGGVTSQQKGIADYAQAEQAKNGGGGLFGDLGPVLGIAGLALGGAGALGLLGDVGAGGALAGDAMGLGTSGAAGLGAGTSAAGLGVGTAATNAGLGSFLTSGLTGGTLGAGALGAGALGAGALASGAGAATGGGMSFDLFDPSTWSNPFSGFFSSGTGTAPSTDFSSLIKPDGSLDYNALAARDAADFGPSGVNALGNSLGYSGGMDYANPMLSDSQIAQMINGNPSLAGQISNYVANNPGSTAQMALKALMGGGPTGFMPLAQLASGLLGYGSAKSAANTQANAAQNAINAEMGMFNTLNGQQAPYRSAGYSSLSSLLGGEGLGPASGGVSSGQFTHAFDANDLKSNLAPNYNFMLNQGLGAVANENSATGGLLSGNTMKALQDYAQNYASNAYQNAFNNYNANQTNIFNRLSSLAGLGQTANSQSVTAGTPIAEGVGTATQNVGTARAGGIVGGSNALSGGFNNAAALMAALPASYYRGA